MKAQIIPTINADNFEEIEKKIKELENVSDKVGFEWIQIDVADGTFTQNKLWHNPADLAKINTKLKIEVHLMVSDIDNQISFWLVPSVDRIIFHFETAKDPSEIIRRCKEAGKEVVMAITPDTFYMEAVFFKDQVDGFQILGVVPGVAGQSIQEDTFEKIKNFRNECESCIIEIDGGMNEKTGKKAVEAGANLIAMASAIFKEGDILDNIKKLQESIN